MKNFLLDRVAHYIAKRMVRFVLLGIFNIIGISSVAGIPIVAIVDALFILLMLNDIKNTSVRAVGSSVRAVQSSVSNVADIANDITQAGVQTAFSFGKKLLKICLWALLIIAVFVITLAISLMVFK